MANSTKAKTLAYSPLITQAQLNEMLTGPTAQMQLQQLQLLQQSQQLVTYPTLPSTRQLDPYNRSQWELQQPSQQSYDIITTTTTTTPWPDSFTITTLPLPPDPRLVELGMQLLASLPYDLDGDIQLTHAQFLAAVAYLKSSTDTPHPYHQWRGHALVDVSV